MKNAAIGIAVIGALVGTPALAADMPLKAPPPAPIATWTGFYIGANAGGAWGSFDPSTTTAGFKPQPGAYFLPEDVPAFNAVGQPSIKPSGFTGGLELGYNWQSSSIVYGLEGDIEWFHLSGSSTTGPVVIPFDIVTINSSAHTDWLATARGRLGIAENNWLFFATGGAAFTTLNGSFSFSDAAPTFGMESASLSATKVGYAVGGGVEAKLWANWSVKAEYLFADFGRVSVNSNNLTSFGIVFPGQVFTHSIDLNANIARLGLNYHFW